MDTKNKVIDLIRIVICFQLVIVGATIGGCFLPGKTCDSDVKQHIANMMTVIQHQHLHYMQQKNNGL